MFKHYKEVGTSRPHFLGIHLTRNYFYFSSYLRVKNGFDEKYKFGEVLYDDKANEIRIKFNNTQRGMELKFDSRAVRINCRISNFMPIGRYVLIKEKQNGDELEMDFRLLPKNKSFKQ